MAMIDTLRTIETYLKTTGTGLYALVADRVFIDPPGFPYNLGGAAALSFSQSEAGSGPMEPPAPVESLQIAFQCWARRPEAAMEVGRALHDLADCIKSETVSVDGVEHCILYARRAGPIQGPFPDDRDQRWFYAYTTYRFDIYSEPFGS
jgi:hypothetical protein